MKKVILFKYSGENNDSYYTDKISVRYKADMVRLVPQAKKGSSLDLPKTYLCTLNAVSFGIMSDVFHSLLFMSQRGSWC